MKLKPDIINYGNDSIRIDYLKVKKANGKTYVEIALIGKDAKMFDEKSNKLTTHFYGSKEHAQSIVLPAIRNIIKLKQTKQRNANIFSGRDFAMIERNTENNNHTENLVFIAKKMNYSRKDSIIALQKRQEQRGYLNGSDMDLKYKIYQDMMKELKQKYPYQYEEVKSLL